MTKNTNCDNPDGKIEIDVSGISGPFSYEWVRDGKIVSTLKNPSALNGGDYALTVRPKKNRYCSARKHVFLHGVIFSEDDCTPYKDKEMSVMKSISISEDSDNYYLSVNWESLPGEREEGSMLYREKTGLEFGKVVLWEELPKAIEELPKDDYPLQKGKTYEFVNVFEKGYFGATQTGLVSKSITVGYYTNNGSTTFKSKNVIENKVSLFPQPASDYITLNLLSNIKANSLEILTLNGQLKREVITDFYENLKLDVSDLESGLYMLKINTNSEALFKKLIIN